MKILNEDQLSVRPVPTVRDTDIPKCTIIINGELTDTVVRGVVLEAAINWDNHYLIFLTDDVPYEDALNIHLLDKELNCIDSARIGSIYSTGTFKSLDITGPAQVSFRFIGDTDWGIELLPESVFSLPFMSDPKGVSRAFGFSKHFRISGNPVPMKRREADAGQV